MSLRLSCSIKRLAAKMCKQVASKGHYWHGSCYIEECIHYGKAKCIGTFSSSWQSNAKWRNVWIFVILTLEELVKLKHAFNLKLFPPCTTPSCINLTHLCVNPHANTSTPSIKVSTPFASPLAPSNLLPNVLKELKAPMCLCAIFSSYKSIQFF